MKSHISTFRLFGSYFKISSTVFKPSYLAILLVCFFFMSSELFAGNSKNKTAQLVNGNTSSSFMPSGSSFGTTESMRINLYLLNPNNTTILADGVLTEYNNLYHDNVTLEDAYKFTNINENLGLHRYGSVLAIERRPIILVNDTLFLKLWKTTSRSYQFEFVSIKLNHPDMQAFLEDTYLDTRTALSLSGTTKLNFTVNADAASGKTDRFRIVYRPAFVAAVLPVTFTSVKGHQQNNSIAIDWNVENEIAIERYEVERSANGTDFLKLSSVAVSKLSHASGAYSWVDVEPVNGNMFYRIRSVDRDGSGKFSAIVKVNMGKMSGGSILIYPNPIKSNLVNLKFTNQQTGVYQVRLINNSGQVIYFSKLNVSSSNSSQALFTNKNLAGGIYQMEIKAPDNTINVQQAIVQE